MFSMQYAKDVERIGTQWILSAEVWTILFKKRSGNQLGMMGFLNSEGMEVFVRSYGKSGKVRHLNLQPV